MFGRALYKLMLVHTGLHKNCAQCACAEVGHGACYKQELLLTQAYRRATAAPRVRAWRAGACAQGATRAAQVLLAARSSRSARVGYTHSRPRHEADARTSTAHGRAPARRARTQQKAGNLTAAGGSPAGRRVACQICHALHTTRLHETIALCTGAPAHDTGTYVNLAFAC